MRTPLALIVAIAASTLLVSCAGSTQPESNSTPAPTLTATVAPAVSATPVPGESSPSPTPEAPAVPASIIVGAEALDVVDASGTALLSVKYSDDGENSVAKLTELLGDPTTTEHFEVTPHSPETDSTIWGGLQVAVRTYGEESGIAAGDQRYVPNMAVLLTSQSTNTGVTLAAVDGTQVGDSFSGTAEDKPDQQVSLNTPGGFDTIAVDLPTSFPGIITEGYTTPAVYGVIAHTEVGADTVEIIRAPDYLVLLY